MEAVELCGNVAAGASIISGYFRVFFAVLGAPCAFFGVRTNVAGVEANDAGKRCRRVPKGFNMNNRG
jgi:hypothetical protein